MNQSQFDRLQEIREHLKLAYAMLEKLAGEEIKERYLKNYLQLAEAIVFDLLTTNLNKVEHDVIHIGIKK